MAARNKVSRISHARILTARKEGKAHPNKRKKTKRQVVRGKEVTVRDSSLERQVIYGNMRVGGATTFIDTSQDSKAYLITGSSDRENEIVWTANTVGSVGNQITVKIIHLHDHPTLIIDVVGNDITVTIRSIDGFPQNTATQVILAVRANVAANALVAVERLNKTVNGYVAEQEQTTLAYGGGNWLHQLITLTSHQTMAVDKLFLDNREVTFGGSPDPRWGTGIWDKKVFMSFLNGDPNQGSSADLSAQLPTKWTSAHRQRECAGVYLILVWSQNLFPDGYPEIQFQMRGKICYDPRIAAVVYTLNPAIIVADYLTNTLYGEGIPYGLIDEPSLIVAANICDQLVTIAGGGTEARYEISGAFDAGDDVLDELFAAMAGDLVYQGGKYYIYAGAYRAPDIDLTLDDLRGEISFNTNISRREIFNSVRGTFADPAANYNETDVPAVINNTYIASDGGKLWEDIGLNFVTSSARAQRLFKIALERVRQGIQVTFPAKLIGMKAICCGTVRLTIPRFGWTNKIFEVRSVDLVLESDGIIGADLLLRETASSVWDWSNGEQTVVDPAPDTNLPSPTTVLPPSNLLLTSGTDQLYIRLDGTVAARVKVSWTASETDFVSFGGSYELQMRLNASEVPNDPWRLSQTVPGDLDFYFILDVQDGRRIDVRIRALNTIGYASTWVEVTNHFVIGKTAPPSDVTDFTATKRPYGIETRWTGISDTDADQYEIRVGGVGWSDAGPIWRGRGEAYVWAFRTAGVYILRIKAIDTSGNYSITDDFQIFYIFGPSAPTVDAVITGEDLIITWTEPTTHDFAIKEYEIRYGANYASGISIGVITGLAFRTHINWLGDRTFWIAARDIADNEGPAGSDVVTILAPNAVTGFNPKVIDNNVLLDWNEPIITSLPVHHYLVWKGDVFETAELLGTVYGTFHTYIERRGGTFKYWIVAYDTAANASTPTSGVATVTEPDDFFIRDDSDISGDLIDSRHAARGDSTVIPGTDPTSYYIPLASTIEETLMPLIPLTAHETWQTWAEFFLSHGFTSMQDAIDAGYTTFFAPTTDEPGYLEFKVDYEVVFSSSFIALSWEEEIYSPHINYTPTISYSEDDISYTVEAGAYQVFAEDFRYVKYKIDFQADDDKAMSRLYNIRARLSLKIEEEYGPVDVFSTDYNPDPDLDGTFVPFEKDFLDVRDIQITILGGSEGDNFVLNFEDIPNPLGFRILLFDKDGSRISGIINRRVIGAVNPL